MQSHWNSYRILSVVIKGYKHFGKVWQFLIKLNIHSPHDPVISLLGIPKRNENFTFIQKIWCLNIHRGFTHNHQKVKVTQMPFNCDMDKQSIVHTYNGIPLDNKRKWTADTHIKSLLFQSIMLRERSHTAQIIYYMITFIWCSEKVKVPKVCRRFVHALPEIFSCLHPLSHELSEQSLVS